MPKQHTTTTAATTTIHDVIRHLRCPSSLRHVDDESARQLQRIADAIRYEGAAASRSACAS